MVHSILLTKVKHVFIVIAGIFLRGWIFDSSYFKSNNSNYRLPEHCLVYVVNDNPLGQIYASVSDNTISIDFGVKQTGNQKG